MILKSGNLNSSLFPMFVRGNLKGSHIQNQESGWHYSNFTKFLKDKKENTLNRI